MISAVLILVGVLSVGTAYGFAIGPETSPPFLGYAAPAFLGGALIGLGLGLL